MITVTEANVRLDKLLHAHFATFSRTYFQGLIAGGFVLVNGKVVKKKDKPNIGDEIEVCFQLTEEISLEPENIPLDILYEDDHLLAVHKPAGMVVHPAAGHPRGTFVHALLYHCKNLPFGNTFRPGIVHRLDKDTSGVLLAAKTYEVHQKLIELFSSRSIEKTYLAICAGNPGSTVVNAPIGRHPQRRQEMAVVENGKEAISQIRTLKIEKELSLVEIKPKTGRTHQIRVHLKHLGTPVLGDPVYGSPAANKKHQALRQLLHAQSLKFVHPISQQILELAAPLPLDFFLC